MLLCGAFYIQEISYIRVWIKLLGKICKLNKLPMKDFKMHKEKKVMQKYFHYTMELFNHIALCYRNFQNVKLRIDFVENNFTALRFYVTSNFGKFKWAKNVIFGPFEFAKI